MKILVVDDGVGAFPTVNKLCYCLPADYTVLIFGQSFPLGERSAKQLFEVAYRALNYAQNGNFDAVVFSSVTLAMTTVKTLSRQSPLPLFGCEIPLVHSCTYTASQVLAVGDEVVAQHAKRFASVIPLALPCFSSLAESGADERTVVAYVAENIEKYAGSFDCIALGNSSMNLYKNCFSRVFPNAKIFDGLDGVARKMRKTFKKNKSAEPSVRILGENNENLLEKYNFFLDELS